MFGSACMGAYNALKELRKPRGSLIYAKNLSLIVPQTILLLILSL
jgi:hypothetical protein